MYILGISEEHDAGAAIIKDDKIIAAVNEERLNRKKFFTGFPKLSIQEVLDIANIKGNEISSVALASTLTIKQPVNGDKNEWLKYRSYTSYFVSNKFLRFFFFNHLSIKIINYLFKYFNYYRLSRIKKNLKKFNINCKINIVDHHFAHACSAYYTSGWKDSLVITFDAAGDGYCSKVFLFSKNKYKLLNSVLFFNSPGYYYLGITLNAGFKAGREGKIMGLAARGNYKKTVEVFNKRLSYEPHLNKFKYYGKYFTQELKELEIKLRDFNLEDIAAGLQKFTEEIVIKYIYNIINKHKLKNLNLSLAGGIFANVLLNQKIGELNEIKEIFIHPHMGDGGLALGSAYALLNKHSLKNKVKFENNKINHVYLGRKFNEFNILNTAKLKNFNYEKIDNIEKIISKKLSEGKVVARFKGAMEYGPRALGNRSILYKPDDKSANEWLNQNLKRTEYMPFAPIVMEEYADEYFEISEKIKFASNFMTITCNTKKICKDKANGIVHIDGTARPQIVNQKINPSLHKILKYYYEFTGLPLLINTSFNIHEEPIVNSPDEAILTCEQGKFDYLAIENILINTKKN